jgi:hypothetical protein
VGIGREVTNQFTREFVDVDTFEVIELLATTVENTRAKRCSDVIASAVEYFSVHGAPPSLNRLRHPIEKCYAPKRPGAVDWEAGGTRLYGLPLDSMHRWRRRAVHMIRLTEERQSRFTPAVFIQCTKACLIYWVARGSLPRPPVMIFARRVEHALHMPIERPESRDARRQRSLG